MAWGRIKKQTIMELTVIWICGIIFLLFFSYMTSPIFPRAYGWDSSFFQLVGAGMTKGYLPYRDFFDMKGPWLFFIEYVAELLWYGRTGIFIIQCIWLCIVLLLCRQIYQKYFSGKGIVANLMVLLPLFAVLSSTMEGGNLTEEWSLPFLFLPLYFALEFIIGEKEEHKPLYGFVYGVCFGIIALIRITNSVMICAIVLTVLFPLIKGRKWINILCNMGAFLIGIAAAFVIPLLYFGYHGEIGNMLYCVFVFGFIYGTEGYGIGIGAIFLLTLCFPVVVLVLTRQKKKRMRALVLWNTAGMLITLGMGNSTMHDYIMIIPGMMLGVWMLAEEWKDNQWGRTQKALVIAAVVLCFAYPCYKMARAGQSILGQIGDDTLYQRVMETKEYIPQEEQDSVWGYGIPLRWYAITEIMPYSRYCGWQDHYMQLSEQVELEIKNMLEETPPKWIVTRAEDNIENEMVKRHLREEYSPCMENEDYRVYQRRE